MVATFTKSGAKAVTPAKLDKSIFGTVPRSHELLKAAYVAYLANGRGNNAMTKTRGEIRGGGKKPWRQKGTGRARFGSSRNPIWRGGGITFGPTGIENYKHALTTAAKRKAVCQALSIASNENKLLILEDFTFKDMKTKEAATLMAKIGATGTTLIAVTQKTPELERTVRNLPTTKLVQATYLSVYDILNADSVVLTKDSLSAITTWLSPVAKSVQKEAVT
jgi:large subunit ribosomal protein L4